MKQYFVKLTNNRLNKFADVIINYREYAEINLFEFKASVLQNTGWADEDVEITFIARL